MMAKGIFRLMGHAGLGLLLCSGSLMAQGDVPLLRPEEEQVVDEQAMEFNQAIEPALKQAAMSTVRIWKGRYRLAYGTVIGDGTLVLTKWSEVDRWKGDGLVVESAGGRVVNATLTKVYPDEDLALLEWEGEPLTPVTWSDARPVLGSFLAAPQPDGRLAGFGVLSVEERNLREIDKAFLGVVGEVGFEGRGVKVREVSDPSGAAEAGVRPGDVIIKLGDRDISGLMELQNSLVPEQPGSTVQLTLLRDGQEQSVDVLLGSRPQFPNYLGARQAQMERMGTRLNKVRDSFSSAIQTDMGIEPNQIGGPVVNLDGEVVGITVARADRTRSFVMSAKTVSDLLEGEGMDPMLARAQLEEQQAKTVKSQEAVPRPAARRVSPERLQDHLGEMRRLMDFMRREMDALEGR